MVLGHIGLPVNDLKKAKFFYDSIIEFIGLTVISIHDDFVGYGENSSYRFYLHTEREGLKGLHLCFEVESRELVDKFYDAALNSGGIDNGRPGIREQYSPSYYAAFVIDPEGNNIETVCKK